MNSKLMETNSGSSIMNLNTKMCSDHPDEEIKAFCRTDFVGVCVKCLLQKHKLHDLILLEELSVSEIKSKIEEYEKSLDYHISKTQNVVSGIQETKREFDQSSKKIDGIFSQLKAMFEKEYFKNQIVRDVEKGQTDFHRLEQKALLHLEQLSFLHSQLKNLEEDPSNVYIYDKVKKKLEESIDEIEEMQKLVRKQSVKIAEFNDKEIIDSMSDFFQKTFLVKRFLSDSKTVHYFEWGNKNVHFYDLTKNLHTKFTINFANNVPKFCRTVLTDDARIFCIGGRHQDNMCCDWTLEFIEDKKNLEYRSPLLFKRSDFTSVYSDRGYIYVIGGNDAKSFYASCEKYSVDKDKWTRIADMQTARDSAASCLFDNKYIYVFSGRTKFDRKEITETIELYTIRDDTWRVLNLETGSEWTPCDLAMSHQINDREILIFGGFDQTQRTNQTYIFNTQKRTMQKWKVMSKVGSFSNFVFCYDSRLYIVGWNNSTKNLYVYDIEKEQWDCDARFAI